MVVSWLHVRLTALVVPTVMAPSPLRLSAGLWAPPTKAADPPGSAPEGPVSEQRAKSSAPKFTAVAFHESTHEPAGTLTVVTAIDCLPVDGRFVEAAVRADCR